MLNYAASFRQKFGKNKSFESLKHLLLVLCHCNGFLKMKKQYSEIFFSLRLDENIHVCMLFMFSVDRNTNSISSEHR